jgi:hypothetical protein
MQLTKLQLHLLLLITCFLFLSLKIMRAVSNEDMTFDGGCLSVTDALRL